MKILLPFWLALFSLLPSCHPPIAARQGSLTENSKEALGKPYLLLISCDGFRWDYVERFQPQRLKDFIAKGVAAESMIPCYPSKTFPNHFSIATGMYPDHHGLVDNSFYSPNKKAEYRTRDREKVEDGSWYGGTPIWVQATKSGMVTASYFFVGSEADVQGIRPTYYHQYDGSVSNNDRVDAVLDWLKLPEKQRPHLITLYFSDMDDVGHRYGPHADEQLREALLKLDESLGRLFDGISATGLPVTTIIVSDHGMYAVPVDQLIATETVEDDDRYRTVSNGALIHFYLHDGVDKAAVFHDLKEKENHFRVYYTEEVPYFETPPTSENWGDIMAIPDAGWYFASQRTIGLRKTGGQKEIGEHGYDPGIKDLQGIFYANGPSIQKGLRIGSFKNIHVYPFMCKILGIDIPENVDGDLNILQGVLK
ncbi:MAG: ectonucleotide pyrophosphatase/phosphodiesterase [Saprospiraceae bacterium]